MPTVITDKTDFTSIEKILEQFDEETKVDIYSSNMLPLERAIVMSNLEISELVVQPDNDKLLFILSNGTIIERQISSITGLENATAHQLKNYENMGNGILWEEIPQADISLKQLIQEELFQKFNLKVA